MHITPIKLHLIGKATSLGGVARDSQATNADTVSVYVHENPGFSGPNTPQTPFRSQFACNLPNPTQPQSFSHIFYVSNSFVDSFGPPFRLIVPIENSTIFITRIVSNSHGEYGTHAPTC